MLGKCLVIQPNCFSNLPNIGAPFFLSRTVPLRASDPIPHWDLVVDCLLHPFFKPVISLPLSPTPTTHSPIPNSPKPHCSIQYPRFHSPLLFTSFLSSQFSQFIYLPTYLPTPLSSFFLSFFHLTFPLPPQRQQHILPTPQPPPPARRSRDARERVPHAALGVPEPVSLELDEEDVLERCASISISVIIRIWDEARSAADAR